MPPKDPKKLAAWRKAIIALAEKLKRTATPTAPKRGRPKGSGNANKSKSKKNVKTNVNKNKKSLYEKLNPNINPFAQKFGPVDLMTAPVRWPWNATKWAVKNPKKSILAALVAERVGNYMGLWGNKGGGNSNTLEVSGTDQIITNDSSVESQNLGQTDDFKGFERRGGRVRRGGQRKYGGQRLGAKKMGGVPGMSKGGSSLVKINGNWTRK
jgi:hypothetical protein